MSRRRKTSRTAKLNPPMSLDERDDLALGHIFGPSGNLLVFSWSPDVPLSSEGRLEGMLLTRVPEPSDQRHVDVYQVTRSGVRPDVQGLGPRLYQYAMKVLSDASPAGVLEPDNQLSPFATHVWRSFPSAWRLGADRDPLRDIYTYAGDDQLSRQLDDAERRGADDFAAFVRARGELQAWFSLHGRALDTFGAAVASRRQYLDSEPEWFQNWIEASSKRVEQTIRDHVKFFEEACLEVTQASRTMDELEDELSPRRPDMEKAKEIAFRLPDRIEARSPDVEGVAVGLRGNLAPYKEAMLDWMDASIDHEEDPDTWDDPGPPPAWSSFSHKSMQEYLDEMCNAVSDGRTTYEWPVRLQTPRGYEGTPLDEDGLTLDIQGLEADRGQIRQVLRERFGGMFVDDAAPNPRESTSRPKARRTRAPADHTRSRDPMAALKQKLMRG